MPGRIRLVAATRNQGKLVEIRELLADHELEVIGAIEAGAPEIDEDGDTFAANAARKALGVARALGLPALADDSGLEVDALGGAPGVISARFAGPEADDVANNAKLLELLAGIPAAGRRARFRSVVALADPAVLGDRVLDASGVCEGVILEAPRGQGGFGYDPLFFSPELGMTFAEAGVGKKHDVSHRARAMAALRPLLLAHFRLQIPPGEGR
jgi:XTP/dITP diphosphohydrolase